MSGEGSAVYFAHSANAAGVPHDLFEHLTAVAERAGQFAAKLGAKDVGLYAGLWHDLGKLLDDFQVFIADPSSHRGPDHSTVGAIVAASWLEPLALIVGGHHGGLSSPSDLKARIQDTEQAARAREALRRARECLSRLEPDTPLESLLPDFLRGAEEPELRRRLEMFLRLVFSALTDADFLDTEQHFHPQQAAVRARYPSLQDLWSRFAEDQARLNESGGGPVNALRAEVYRACLDAASSPQGIFRLTVPTGGGKTRSGMGFALRHALEHDLDRVIVAIPYTSIVEQTVDVYRGIFGSEAVVEHHSAVADDLDEWSRLASENWDAPIIVTTTVQLFESLFANRSSRCRKLHNIACSVVILDEVQTLPEGLLEPILDAIQELADHYGTTVVLCTATQPALESGPYVRGLRSVREIIPNPARYFAALTRVRYETPAGREPWPWERVAAEMRDAPECLAVVNTKADALALLDALGDEKALYLSTSLCGAHRRDVLAEVRRRMAAAEPCRLVSTQVVEAGVDLDFPLVLRAAGPLDRIVQAAGRCNREGRLAEGRVVIFDPADGHLPPGTYRTATETTRNLLSQPTSDLNDPDLYRRYFLGLYQGVELDAERIQPERERLNYPEVAKRFRLIKDDTAPVIVRYGERADADLPALLNAIRREEVPPRWAMRRLQPYLVSMRSRLLPRLESDGLARPIAAGLWEWLGRYDAMRGLVAEGPDPADLVV